MFDLSSTNGMNSWYVVTVRGINNIEHAFVSTHSIFGDDREIHDSVSSPPTLPQIINILKMKKKVFLRLRQILDANARPNTESAEYNHAVCSHCLVEQHLFPC